METILASAIRSNPSLRRTMVNSTCNQRDHQTSKLTDLARSSHWLKKYLQFHFFALTSILVTILIVYSYQIPIYIYGKTQW